MSVTVSINFVDGGYVSNDYPDTILDQLAQLRAAGYDGKRLIDALLTDDWGPPPVRVHIEGNSIDEWIGYD
jgi:hypothetical protein